VIDVYLHRVETSDEGTFGLLMAEGKAWRTAELPWRDNRHDVSCIPAGTYAVRYSHSKHFGPCYRLADVPGRSGILFHSGNFAGDEKEGLKTDSKGCILPGQRFGKLSGQKAVLSSRSALKGFEAALGRQDFILRVFDVVEGWK